MSDNPAPSYMCPKCHRVSYHPEDVKQFYCGVCHVTAEELRRERVTDFAHITNMYLTRRDCMSLALLTLTDHRDNPEARLVHGWVRNSFTGELTEHAWCEMPAIATYEDGSEGPITVMVDYTQVDERARIMPVEFGYEKMGGVSYISRYTFVEALVLAAKAGHDGPWPEDDRPSNSSAAEPLA
jgi:hypothetical protein